MTTNDKTTRQSRDCGRVRALLRHSGSPAITRRSFPLLRHPQFCYQSAMLRPLLVFLVAAASTFAAETTPIAVSDLKRDKRIDFANEVLPLFRKSCLACHNATDAKGDLVLETPATIIKG